MDNLPVGSMSRSGLMGPWLKVARGEDHEGRLGKLWSDAGGGANLAIGEGGECGETRWGRTCGCMELKARGLFDLVEVGEVVLLPLSALVAAP
jgi:hypothetical protein